MAKVTFLLGLAGSGKSYLAEELRQREGALIFEGIAASQNADLFRCMVQSLMRGSYCVVEEIAFCRPQKREEVEQILRSEVPGIEIEWLCFENDLESANWNVRHRTNKGSVDGHLGINEAYHTVYEYPQGAKVIPIVRTTAREDT